jgi:hypothetical protein
MTRMVVARVLVVLAAVFAVLGLLAGFVRWQALDNDTFTVTAGELIANDQVRNEIALRLTDELFQNVDVAARLEERLPSEQDALAPIVAAGVRELTNRAAVRLLERPRPQQVWLASLSRTHEQLLRLLDDDLTALSTSDGVVVLDLRPLVIQLGDEVAVFGRLATALPEDAGAIEIMESRELEQAQDITQLLKTLGTFLWLVAPILAAIALWIARGNRRAILRMLAIAAIATGLVEVVLVRFARRYVLDNLVANPSAEPAVRDAWDILTRQLTDGGRTLIGIGIVLLVGVWFAGATRSATAVRARVAPSLARPEIAFGGAALAWLLLVWWGPTFQTRLWYGVLAFAVLFAIGAEVLRRIAEREPTAEPRPEAAPEQALPQPGA